MASRSPAVEVAKNHQNGKDPDGPVTLSTGVRAILKAVPAGLIDESQAKIKDPPVPLQTIEGRDLPVENPLDPDYQAGLREANQARGNAIIDVMVLFGMELVDGVPADDNWLKKLKFLEKRNRIDLSSYDLDDELEREFVYKRFVATGTDDLVLIGQISGIRDVDVQQARETFQG